MKKFFIILFAFFGIFTKLFGVGMAVFDLENWLKTIDELYATYDMVNNTIAQIENQYKMIAQNIEKAKNIDWENISFDGDFDIRDDIKNATARINNLLDSTRNIKNALTTPNINCGSNSYSIADLCGINGAGKNIYAALQDSYNYMTDNMKNAILNLSKELTQEEKIAIMNKYGISPENYLFLQQSMKQVKDKVSLSLGKVTDDAVKLKMKTMEDSSAIYNAAMSSVDSDGNMTEGASREATLLYCDKLVEGLVNLGYSMDEAQALIAAKYTQELNEKETEIAERSNYFNQKREEDAKRMEGFMGIMEE